MITVELRLTPLDAPVREMSFDRAMTVADILTAVEAPDWFAEHGVVAVNGHQIMRRHWKRVKIKSKPRTVVELTIVQGDKSTLAIAGSVALIAATGFIGAGGLAAFGGSLFAAGSLGASAAAAAVGIAGQLAIGALTAGPAAGPAETQKPMSNAGISGNAITPGELLPVILGTVIYSPPMISRSYTTWDGAEMTGHAIYGVQGRCAIADVLVNEVAASDLEGLVYETREGAPGDAALTLAQRTIVQTSGNIELSNFLTNIEAQSLGDRDQLADFDDPDSCKSKWHHGRTAGEVDELWLRYLAPNGFSSDTLVAIRTELRLKGDTAWRALPTLHVTDFHDGGPMRFETQIKWQKQPSGRHFSNATDYYSCYEASSSTAKGQAFAYDADPYFIDDGFNINGVLPSLTSASGGGVTMSAQSELSASFAAWKASDTTGTGTYWQPAGSSPDQWIQVQFSAPTLIKSATIIADGLAVSAYTPTKVDVWATDDGINWTNTSGGIIDWSDLPLIYNHFQIGSPGAFIYHRFIVKDTVGHGAPRIAVLNLHADDAIGSAMGPDRSIYSGGFCLHDSENTPRCRYVSISARGPTIYLDPDQWPVGEYEWRTKRSYAFNASKFEHISYTYAAGGVSRANADFFEYYAFGDTFEIREPQSVYRTDMVLETSSSVSYDVPVDTTGIACIALEMKNTVVNSVAATFSSYAPVWDNGSVVWFMGDDDQGFSGAGAGLVQGEGYVTTSSSADPYFQTPSGLTINGAANTIIEVVLARVSGTGWEGRAFYERAGKTFFSPAYSQVTDEPEWHDGWSTIRFDMSGVGGTDWVDNTITRIRFDLGSGSGDVFRIKSVSVLPADETAGVWTEVQQITANPAALARYIRLGHANAWPTPAELIEADAFETWYTRCAANGHECNAVLSDMVVEDVEAMVGACGWAAIRKSNEIGVIEDYDTSAEPVRNPLTPANSRNLGMEVNTPVLPHALRVQYFDESDNYAPAEVMVYRDGYDASNATLIETRAYPGFTNTTRVTARAVFDFRQLQLRAKRYKFEVGREGMNFRRGMLTGITDPTLDISHAAAWINATEIVAGNVVSMTLSHIMPWGAVQGGIDAITDLDSLADIMDLTAPMGVCLCLTTGGTVLKQVSNVVDSNTCVFTTPFPEAEIADGVERVGVGRWGNVVRRAKVMSVMPTNSAVYTIECADEAPGLFA